MCLGEYLQLHITIVLRLTEGIGNIISFGSEIPFFFFQSFSSMTFCLSCEALLSVKSKNIMFMWNRQIKGARLKASCIGIFVRYMYAREGLQT